MFCQLKNTYFLFRCNIKKGIVKLYEELPICIFRIYVSVISLFSKIYYDYKIIQYPINWCLNGMKCARYFLSNYKKEPLLYPNWLSISYVEYKPITQEPTQNISLWNRCLCWNPFSNSKQGFNLVEKYDYNLFDKTENLVESYLYKYSFYSVLFSSFHKIARTIPIAKKMVSSVTETQYLILMKYNSYYLSKIVYINPNIDTHTESQFSNPSVYYGEENAAKYIHENRNIDHSQDTLTYKILNSTMCQILSNIRFITIQYFHPKMNAPIEIVLPDDFYVIGNQLLSFEFVLRYLYYQGEHFIFDCNYTIQIMNSEMDIFEVKWNQYIILEKDVYSVKGNQV